MINEEDRKELMLSMESSHTLTKVMQSVTPGSFLNLVDGFTAISSDLVTNILPTSRERAYKDATKLSSRTRNKLVDMSIIDISKIRFMTPERLTGNLLAVLDDLITANGVISEQMSSVISSLSRDASMLLNVGIEDMQSPTSYMSAMKLRKSREACMASISSNFKATKVTSYGVVGEHFRTPEQIGRFLIGLNSLEVVINSKKWDRIVQPATELNEKMLEVLDYLKVLDDKSYKSRPVRELNEAFYEVAKSYEFVGYIQAKTLQLFQSTKSLCENIMSYKI